MKKLPGTKSPFSLVAVLVLLCGCYQEKLEVALDKDPYFDLLTVIDQQTKSLMSENPSVIKTVSVAGESQEQTLENINWEEELKIFRGADINKPVWQGAFEVKKVDNTTQYLALQTGLKVKELEVAFQNEEIHLIKAILQEENFFYGKKTSLRLEFDNGRLISYQVKGEKLLLLNQPMVYSVKADISYQAI